MRIAFASCFCTRVFPTQPVWAQMASLQPRPDHLVLLGDSIYLDIKVPVHPFHMDEMGFAEHLVLLYNELLAQPQFLALLQSMPPGTVHSIWDDHDFLWDNALGAEVALQPQHAGKIRLSTAAHALYRAALAQGGTGFPASATDPRLWDAHQPPLETPSLPLAPDLWLHLLDVRSVRTRTWLLPEARRTLLGEAQKARVGAAVAAAPDAVHLLASGSTLAGWQRYTRDRQWLLDLARAQRMLVLSGDIHRNELDAFYTGGWPLHEATSSGAAIRDAVILGAERRNFGLLDVDAATVTVRLFNKAREEMQRILVRATWLPR